MKVKISINAELEIDQYQLLTNLLQSWGVEIPDCKPDCSILPVSLICIIPEESDAIMANIFVSLTDEETREFSEDISDRRKLAKQSLMSRIHDWLLTADGIRENARSCWDFNWGDALQWFPHMGISFHQPVAGTSQFLPFVTLLVDHDELLAQEDVPGTWTYRVNGVDSQPYPVNIDMRNGEVWPIDGPPDGIPADAEFNVTLSNGVSIPCDRNGNLIPR